MPLFNYQFPFSFLTYHPKHSQHVFQPVSHTFKTLSLQITEWGPHAHYHRVPSSSSAKLKKIRMIRADSALFNHAWSCFDAVFILSYYNHACNSREKSGTTGRMWLKTTILTHFSCYLSFEETKTFLDLERLLGLRLWILDFGLTTCLCTRRFQTWLNCQKE